MATTDATKPIIALVLDTGPIIKNETSVSTLISQAQTLYTIPAVIDEIRDAVTRARVETTLLPFLKLRAPRPASVKVITDFARRTGDLEVLSRPDIHLMALAYELECEVNGGDWRLRSVPGQKGLNGKGPAKDGDEKAQEQEGGESIQETKPATIVEAPLPKKNAWGIATPAVPAVSIPVSDEGADVGRIENALKDTHISVEPQPEVSQIKERQPEELKPASDSANQISPQAANTHLDMVSQSPPIEHVEESDSDDENLDGGGWITPKNLKKYQEKDNGTSATQEELRNMAVAIMTSDFAMQNVLLRMNLNLLTPSFQRVKKVKAWVLRCHACFHVTKDMTKQFCGRCGKPTLLRTSCSTNSDGSFKIFLKKNMQWNKRGDVFSIPKPVAGTSNGKLVAGGGKGGWGQSLILAEDQKEYIQAVAGNKRNKTKDLMDEDYLPSLLSGDRGHAGGKPKVGGGRNVNSKKRR